MKYPLNYKNEFSSSLLFWITRFIRYKLTTLSNHQVNDKSSILQAINTLSNDKISNIDELENICKKVKAEFDFSELDTFLVVKDIVYRIYKKQNEKIGYRLENV